MTSPYYYLIEKLALSTIEKVVRKTIKSLQQRESFWSDGFELNFWDDICICHQVGERCWQTGLEHINSLLYFFIEDLPEHDKELIWLITPEGRCWDDEEFINTENKHKSIPYDLKDICNYIMEDFLIVRAREWKNKRITTYYKSCYLI